MFNNPIQYLKGVGPAKAKQFEAIAVRNIGQLIAYLPRGYENRTNLKNVADIKDGEYAVVRVKCLMSPTFNYVRRGMDYIKCLMGDKSGAVQVVIYNQRYLLNKLIPEKEYLICGVFNYKNVLQVANPVVEKIDEKNPEKTMKEFCKIIPVYPLVKGVSQRVIRDATAKVFSGREYKIDDYLDEVERNKFDLIDLENAIKEYHYPSDNSMCDKAHRRLAFDELLMFQVALRNMKRHSSLAEDGISYDISRADDIDKIHNFALTNAQQRVLGEILKDMARKSSMNRLVQGDVGCGKTAIAMSAMYVCVKNGYQAVLMAPTEVLATQHFESFTKTFESYGIRVALLKGKMKKTEKNELIKNIKSHQVDIVIGTHALLEDEVEFAKLGLIITDEQHRFGVNQRKRLYSKSKTPDVLVMTATPIPRTLALVLYGDLDVSVVDELPPNRQEIKTYALHQSESDRAFKFISSQVQEGRQAYMVCPLIEESEDLDYKSVLELYDEFRLKHPDISVALLHGKMKPQEKIDIMTDFVNNKISVIISTTVIEVGVNVPNSTIMLVQNAERFGLSQLHQLRGRVGRGKHQSYCILLHNAKSSVSVERLKIMQSTNDGFEIAEKDLEIRGPGEIFGTMQHGLPQFKVANLYEDLELIELTKKFARDIEQKEYLKEQKYDMLRKAVENIDFRYSN